MDEAPSKAPPKSFEESRKQLEKLLADASNTAPAVDADRITNYRSLANQFDIRLSWAPAIGNGAAMVACAGIVGNVASPDTALNALTIPLAIFGSGLAFSLFSNMLISKGISLVESANSENESIKSKRRELLAEAHRLVNTATPQNAKEYSERLSLIGAEVATNYERYAPLSRRLSWGKIKMSAASYLNLGAVCAVALGVAVLLAGHSAGRFRLERTQPATNTVGSDAKALTTHDSLSAPRKKTPGALL